MTGSLSSLTYGDLETPDNLSQHERLALYARSRIPLQRLVFASLLGGDQRVDMSLVRGVAADEHWPVREQLARKLDALIASCPADKLGELYQLCSALLRDPSRNVRLAAVTALSRVVADKDKLKDPTAAFGAAVVAAARSPQADVRETSARLVGAFGSRNLGFAVALLTSMQLDANFLVRKEAALALGGLAGWLDESCAERVSVSLLAACRDVTWPVRKAAVSALPALAARHPLVTAELVGKMHSETLGLVKDDAARWVRLAAYACLGPLIVAAGTSSQTAPLLDAFAGIDFDSEAFRYQMAYYLPGVLLGAPAQRWAKLRPLHAQLANDSSANVRRTLACSLADVAAALGPASTQSDLVPALLAFLNDDDDEHGAIRLAAVRSSSRLAADLPAKEAQAQVFAAVAQLCARCRSSLTLARDIRLAIAQELVAFAQLRVDGLAELALCLAQDDVYIVRAAACAAMGKALLAAPAPEQSEAVEQLCKWAAHPSFVFRCIFAWAAKSCIEADAGVFSARLSPALRALQKDKVLAVRQAALAVAKNGGG
jgi:hypothetical protein